MTEGKATLKELQEMVIAFRDARDWGQFNNPKDCAISLSLESAEILEHFLWRKEDETREYVAAHREEIGDELADALFNVLLLAEVTGVELEDAFRRKLVKIGEKYPVDKAKGRKEKYTEL